MKCKCFRCRKEFDSETGTSITLVAPNGFRSMPKLHCPDCIESFYKWAGFVEVDTSGLQSRRGAE